MNFDIHSHFIAQEFVEAISKPGSAWQARLVKKGEESWIEHDQGYSYPLSPGFFDTAARLADMARMKLDMAAVSVSPTLFYYYAKPELALDVARMTNDAICRLTKERPDKFVGMGTLPMQNVELAITELRRSVRDLGFKSILIGSNVEGNQFDDPQFLRFFKECEALDVFIFFHPYYVGTKGMFGNYYLTNLYGNPLDTAMVVANLIFGGVLDKCPKLKVGFTHGGGFFPYQIGRLKHGYEVRNEPKVNGAKSPERYLHQLYFDSIVFMDKQLRFLVDWAGAEHVMLGTDYAFDMGEFAPVDFISGAGLATGQLQAVLSDSACKIFGVQSSAEVSVSR
ncbi:MAG: amidohydrolase family protein [Terriglobales bacterium]